MQVRLRFDAREIDARHLIPRPVEEQQVRVVMVDIVDRQAGVPRDLGPHKVGYLRVVVELSPRARPDLGAVEACTLVVADHGLIEDLTIEVHGGARKRDVQGRRAHRASVLFTETAAAPCVVKNCEKTEPQCAWCENDMTESYCTYSSTSLSSPPVPWFLLPPRICLSSKRNPATPANLDQPDGQASSWVYFEMPGTLDPVSVVRAEEADAAIKAPTGLRRTWRQALLGLFRSPAPRAAGGWALGQRRRSREGRLRRQHPPQPIPANKKICYLNAEDAEKWHDYMQVCAASLEIPVDKFDKFDCFMASSFEEAPGRAHWRLSANGSHHSSKDSTLPWLPQLFDCLRHCATIKHLNLVGICFGCQALAVALGGDVGPNPDGSFEFGRCEVTLADRSERTVAIPSCACAIIDGRCQLHLLEAHGEQVTKLPPGGKTLGWSKITPHELYVAGEHQNVLGCQSHPEFTDELLQSRIEPALREKQRLCPAFQYACECRKDQSVGRLLLRHWLLREH